jgi:hypothetical protein
MVVEPFSTGAVWRMAWAIFKERMGLLIGLFVGVYAINYGVQFGLGFLGSFIVGGQQPGNPPTGAFVIFQFVILIISVILSLWLAAGQTLALVKIARGQEASFNDLFAGGRYIVPIFVGGLVLVAVALGALIAVGIPVGLIAYLVARANQDALLPIIIIGYVLALILMLFVMARFSMYQYAVVDRNLGGLDAIRYSYKITQGYTVSLVGFMIVAGLVGISGVLGCGIGLLFTVPLSLLMYPCAYLILDNQPNVAGVVDRGSDFAEL